MYKINEIYDIYIIYLHIYLHIYIYIYILNYDIYLHAIDHKQRKYRLILYEQTRKSLSPSLNNHEVIVEVGKE